jgi:hypothetical protein
MDVFVVLVRDRHADPEPYVFTDEALAIKRANKEVAEGARHPEMIEDTLTDCMRRAGWIYNVNYSCEGDVVRVQRKTLNEGVA